MCGIHGIISERLSSEEIERRLRLMGSCQRHRGPDDERVEVYESGRYRVGFGFVRLAILDLETGMQPVRDPGDQAALICNGQLYNYLELKADLPGVSWQTRGDAEVALQMFRHYPAAKALNRFNGMYSGAFFDPAGSRVLLFRDRFGIKPLYYCEYDGDLYFASEIKPLLAATGNKKIRHDLLPTLFTYRYLPGTATIFDGIKRLPPGSLLSLQLSNGVIEVENYWQYRFPSRPEKISRAEAEHELERLFLDAVRLRLRSDVEVGSFLSGGIDSCAVAAAAAAHQPLIRLFTIAFDDEKYDESRQVENFVQAAGSRFSQARRQLDYCHPERLAKLPELLEALEEPIFLGAVLPTDQVCELASSRVKTVLTGEGADEIFAGYRKFLLEMAALAWPDAGPAEKVELTRQYPELKSYLAGRAASPLDRYIQSEKLFSRLELNQLLGYKESQVFDLLALGAAPDLSGDEHPLNAALAVESRCRLPDYVILRLDKLAMRHSLEARTPFLDYRLAEFAARLPVEFKVDLARGREKDICRRTFLHSGLLDEETANRRKQPFTSPLANWLAQPDLWPEVVAEALRGNLIAEQGVLDPQMVSRLRERVSAEGVGPATLVSEADRLFAVLIFTLWYEEFRD